MADTERARKLGPNLSKAVSLCFTAVYSGRPYLRWRVVGAVRLRGVDRQCIGNPLVKASRSTEADIEGFSSALQRNPFSAAICVVR